jgi:hypothetical protein
LLTLDIQLLLFIVDPAFYSFLRYTHSLLITMDRFGFFVFLVIYEHFKNLRYYNNIALHYVLLKLYTVLAAMKRRVIHNLARNILFCGSFLWHGIRFAQQFSYWHHFLIHTMQAFPM